MKRNSIISSCLSAIAAIVTIVAITITGELYAPLKDWLKTTFTHHWLGKSIISIAVFAVVFFVSRLSIAVEDESENIGSFISALSVFAILGTHALVGFYLYEYLIHL